MKVVILLQLVSVLQQCIKIWTVFLNYSHNKIIERNYIGECKKGLNKIIMTLLNWFKYAKMHKS